MRDRNYKAVLVGLLFILVHKGFAQDFGLPENFELPQNINSNQPLQFPPGLENQFNLLPESLVTPGFTPSFEREITLIETDEGTVVYGFSQTPTKTTNELKVITAEDTFTSTASNVKFVPSLSGAFLTGEDLEFSSETNERVTTVDRFRFGGSEDEFRLRLDGLDSTGDTSWGASSVKLGFTENNWSGEATEVYIKDEKGDFVEIGKATFNEEDKSIRMTSLIGQSDGNTLSASQLNFMRDGDTDRVGAVDLYIGRGPDEFIKAGTANLAINETRKTLSLTDIDGRAEGFDFTAKTFEAVEEDDNISGKATEVFVRNAEGEFVRIGEAEFDEKSKTLNMKSVSGELEDYGFSADQLNLFENDNGTGANALNLFIKSDELGFIKVGEASLFLSDNRDTLRLISFNGEAEGYRFSGDSLQGTHEDGVFNVNIVNGAAFKDDTSVKFSRANIEGNEDRVDADIFDFSFAQGDLSYHSDRVRTGSDGESFDFNSKGVIKTGSLKLNTDVEFRGLNEVIMSGPGKDGGILLEENSEGRVIKAEGTIGIRTTEEGGIKKLGVSLGEDIYFKATDKEGNARELTASFSYDEKAGKFYLKTVFKGGDETEIKVYPFTFTSEKVGDDAVAALSASLEKQDMQHYLRTMTNIIDLEKINDHLSIGSAGQMQVRVGGDKGMEFYFANDNFSVAQNRNPVLGGPMDDGVALGIGFFNRGNDGENTRSGGVLISSDSSLRYEVHSGTLAFNGMELPDTGRVPLTIGTYYKYEDDRGNAVFGTLGTSLADLGSVSAGVTARKEVAKDTYLSLGGAANTRGKVIGMLTFEYRFGKPSSVNDSSRFSQPYSPKAAGDAARSIYGFGTSQ